MQQFKATCTDGFTKTVSADSKDAAVVMFMADPDFQNHVKTVHPDLLNKSPEEMKGMMMSMTQPVM